MAAKLVALAGFAKGLVLQLDGKDQYIIGRDPEEAALLIEEPSISRRHLLCIETPEGILVKNLSETNPALVNGNLIDNEQLLREGDRIQLGNQELLFTYEDSPELSADLEGVEEEHKEIEASDIDQIISNSERESIMSDEESSVGLTEVHFDLLESGRWVLKVVGGPNNGAEFSLVPGNSYVIGTDPTACDIVFHDISVSRQHARIQLSNDDHLLIEDLKSRNGTYVEDQKLEGKQSLEPNKLVTLGTSTFVVLDTQGERSTIISPLLPSIVKVLQKEEMVPEPSVKESEEPEEVVVEEEKKPPFSLLGAFILIALISGLFAVIGLGLSSLFKTTKATETVYEYDKEIADVMSPYPGVRPSFNENTGRILLVGHVLTSVDKGQLVYNLQSLPFIKSVDDNIIIDELVWREINQDFAKNPEWRSVSMIATAPGRFVLTGYLDTKKQESTLSEYINQNFAYPDRLDNRVVVQEDLLSKAIVILRNNGLSNIRPSFSDGDLKLIGRLSASYKDQLDTAINELSKLNGVRNVQNLILESQASDTAENISSRYRVSGVSDRGGKDISVIINGRILTLGDVLDGMTITAIRPDSILLEKDGAKYRIDYNK